MFFYEDKYAVFNGIFSFFNLKYPIIWHVEAPFHSTMYPGWCTPPVILSFSKVNCSVSHPVWHWLEDVGGRDEQTWNLYSLCYFNFQYGWKIWRLNYFPKRGHNNNINLNQRSAVMPVPCFRSDFSFRHPIHSCGTSTGLSCFRNNGFETRPGGSVAWIVVRFACTPTEYYP